MTHVATDRTSIDMNSGEVKVIKVEENDARKPFACRVNDNVKFPFGLLNSSESLDQVHLCILHRKVKQGKMTGQTKRLDCAIQLD